MTAATYEPSADPAAVQSDEALLGNLSGPVVITDDALARALYAWRRDVEAVPFPVLPADLVAGALACGRRRWAAQRVAVWLVLLAGCVGVWVVAVVAAWGVLT